MFESLRSLSDSQIITGSKVARAQEHSGMLAMIGFIVEIERRQLFLRRGFSSLFSYCMRELGYSEAQAMLRITAARCIVKFPDVFDLLRADEVNLGTISRVSKILTPDNCVDVLNSIRRKSLREVEAIVAEHEPVAVFPKDRVRTIVARIPVRLPLTVGEIHLCNSGKKSAAVEGSTPREPHQSTSFCEPHRDVEGEPQGDDCDTADEQFPETRSSTADAEEPALLAHEDHEGALRLAADAEPDHPVAPTLARQLKNPSSQDRAPDLVVPHKLERRTRIEFTAREELVEKLERIRAIASHRLPARASMEQVIDYMATYVIHREDPVKRHERRQARQLKRGKAPD